MLTATAAAAPSPGAPEERRPCPEGAGLPLLPHVRRFGLGKGAGGEGGAAPRIPAIGGITGSEGRDKGEPSSGALLAGRGRARRDGGRCPWAGAAPAPPRPGGADLGSRWLVGLGGARPPFGFSAAGRPAGQRGILATAFPTDLSKGQAAYANDFNKYFLA